MLSEYIDLRIMENFAVRRFHYLKTSVFNWRPETNSFIRTTWYYMLSSIIQSELSTINISCMSLKAVQELSILTIEHPYHLILSTSD